MIPELPYISADGRDVGSSKMDFSLWNSDKIEVSNISLDFDYCPFGNQIKVTGYKAENINIKAVASFDTEADKWMFKDPIDINASKV